MDVQFKNIVWDTDNKREKLPTETVLAMEDDADVSLEGADALSDKFGFCVVSFDFKCEAESIETDSHGDSPRG